ncbi:MAG: hypothetical protein QM756_03235 [Polyangiaceae bacterium]
MAHPALAVAHRAPAAVRQGLAAARPAPAAARRAAAARAVCRPTRAIPKPPGIADLTAALDSTGKWGVSGMFTGGSFTYGDNDKNGATDITLTSAPGVYTIKGHISGYTGFGMWFGPAGMQKFTCVDASQYSGVSFEITNNATAVPNISFQVQHHSDSPVDTTNSRGGCVYTSDTTKYSDCVYPKTDITLPTGGGVVQVPWSMFAMGKPVADATGGNALDGLQWEFWKEGATAYDLDITVKNVKFY